MSADSNCANARAWLSAFRDGEALPNVAPREHIDACPACMAWEAAIDDITRHLVLRTVASPNVTARALSAWPLAGDAEVSRQRRIARVILTMAGVAGLVLSTLSLSGVSASGGHLVRDLVAFEAALAIGFLLSAWRPERYPRGLAPVAGTAGVLTLLGSAPALSGARADFVAEASHLTVLLGLIGLFVLLDSMKTATPRRRTA